VSLKGKAADGVWSDAMNLGDGINSEESENRPFITAEMPL
jgi:hypothetical protein